MRGHSPRAFPTLFLAIALTMSAAQCGPSLTKPNGTATGDGKAAAGGRRPGLAAAPAGAEDNGANPLVANGEAALNLSGSYQPVILDADGLTSVYRRVFGDQPRAESADSYFQSHPNDFFKPQEKLLLGTFLVTTDRPTFRMTSLQVVTQDYVLTLRHFLADACATLVKRERQTPNDPSNKLVQGDVPSAAKISAFMDLLFGNLATTAGEKGTQEPLNAGAEEYRAVMAKTLANATDPGAREKLVFTVNSLVCFHAGADPRVYLK